VLALSLRATSGPLLDEILDAWFATGASTDADDAENIRHVDDIGH
jgi:ribose 5-phosphate isomerase B